MEIKRQYIVLLAMAISLLFLPGSVLSQDNAQRFENQTRLYQYESQRALRDLQRAEEDYSRAITVPTPSYQSEFGAAHRLDEAQKNYRDAKHRRYWIEREAPR